MRYFEDTFPRPPFSPVCPTRQLTCPRTFNVAPVPRSVPAGPGKIKTLPVSVQRQRPWTPIRGRLTDKESARKSLILFQYICGFLSISTPKKAKEGGKSNLRKNAWETRSEKMSRSPHCGNDRRLVGTGGGRRNAILGRLFLLLYSNLLRPDPLQYRILRQGSGASRKP